MMRRMLRISFIPAAAVASLLALGACSAQLEGYEATPTVAKVPVAEWTVSRLDLRFEPNKATLADGEEARLAQALAMEDSTRPIKLIARTNAAGTPANLAVERAAKLREAAAAHGFAMEFQASRGASVEDPTTRDTAAVYVGRYEVSVPGCPDWRKPTNIDFSNKESTNFGCANAINLAYMLADPKDLTYGDVSGPANGAREAAVVNQYRLGKAPRVAAPDLPDAGAAKTVTEAK